MRLRSEIIFGSISKLDQAVLVSASPQLTCVGRESSPIAAGSIRREAPLIAVAGRGLTDRRDGALIQAHSAWLS